MPSWLGRSLCKSPKTTKKTPRPGQVWRTLLLIALTTSPGAVLVLVPVLFSSVLPRSDSSMARSLKAVTCAMAREKQESVSADLLPKLLGYPSWEQPRKWGDYERVPDVINVSVYCEDHYGNGYTRVDVIAGDPPLGPFRDADVAPRNPSRRHQRPSKGSSRKLKGRQALQQGNAEEGDLRSHHGGTDVAEVNRHAPSATDPTEGGQSQTHMPSQTPSSGQPSGNPKSVRHHRGWLRCFTNPLLRPPICEGSYVAVYPGRLVMSAGGEDLAAAPSMRDDEEELPNFVPGSIEVPVGQSTQRKEAAGGQSQVKQSQGQTNSRPAGQGAAEAPAEGQRVGHPAWTAPGQAPAGAAGPGQRGHADVASTVRESAVSMEQAISEVMAVQKGEREWEMWDSARAVPFVDCGEVVETPTLLFFRNDYVNLYFSMLTWLSAYQAARLAGLRYKPGVVLLDGHAKGMLDPVLSELFGGHRFIKSFDVGSKAVCFRHAIFVPHAYNSAIHYGAQIGATIRCSPRPDWQETGLFGAMERTTEFAEFVVESLGVKLDPAVPWAPRIALARLRSGPHLHDKTGRAVFGPGPAAVGHGQEQQQDERQQQHLRKSGAQPLPSRTLHVLFIRRDPVWVHPRQLLPLSPDTRIQDQERLIQMLRDWSQHHNCSSIDDYLNKRRAADAQTGDESQAEPSAPPPPPTTSSPQVTQSQAQLKAKVPQMRQSVHQVGTSADLGSETALTPTPPSGIVLLNGTMMQWSFRRQLEAVQWADVVVGAHGAGLTHAMFMRPGARLVEMRSLYNNNEVMMGLAKLRGLPYTQVFEEDIMGQFRKIAQAVCSAARQEQQ